MTLAHVKQHWLKYYFGTGAVWTAYVYFSYGNPGVVGIAENVVLWPYKAFQHFTATVSAPAAGMSVTGG